MSATMQPAYWMHRPGTPLYNAIWTWLDGKPMGSAELALIRAYLAEWIDRPEWAGDGILALRKSVLKIDTPGALSLWLRDAEAEGVDPL